MKTFISGLMLVPSLAFGMGIKLEAPDQAKLADLMGKLPDHVKTSSTRMMDGPRKEKRVSIVFPKQMGPFSVLCTASYFNGSVHASGSVCQLTVDEHHPSARNHYDEFKIEITDKEISQALYGAIAQGEAERDFKSHQQFEGISYEGKTSTIHQYFFKCAPGQCTLRFSSRGY